LARRSRPAIGTLAKQVTAYGVLLALGALGLQWLDYQHLARAYSGEAHLAVVAIAFLALGICVGMRLFGAPAAAPFDGNPKARSALGISPRELEILQEIAAGHSNKEIAARLHVAPSTVKTHVANLLGKLDARRRTEAMRKARELGLVP
jgi:DNA-binding CsgD family transcriptional regulator